MDDCRGPSLSRAVKGSTPGPISREGEGLMQGVEHRDALRSHWSNSLSSSSPLGPPSSTENNRHVGFVINTLAWTNQQREGEGQQVLQSPQFQPAPSTILHYPPPLPPSPPGMWAL